MARQKKHHSALPASPAIGSSAGEPRRPRDSRLRRCRAPALSTTPRRSRAVHRFRRTSSRPSRLSFCCSRPAAAAHAAAALPLPPLPQPLRRYRLCCCCLRRCRIRRGRTGHRRAPLLLSSLLSFVGRSVLGRTWCVSPGGVFRAVKVPHCRRVRPRRLPPWAFPVGVGLSPVQGGSDKLGRRFSPPWC